MANSLTVEFIGLVLFGTNAQNVRKVAVINAAQPEANLPMHAGFLTVVQGAVTSDGWPVYPDVPNSYQIDQFKNAPELLMQGIQGQPIDASGWKVVSLKQSCRNSELPNDFWASGQDMQKHVMLPLTHGKLTSCRQPARRPGVPGPIITRWTTDLGNTFTISNPALHQKLTFDLTAEPNVVLQFVNTDTDPNTNDLEHFKWYWWTTSNADSCWNALPHDPPNVPECPNQMKAMSAGDGPQPRKVMTPYGIGCSNSNYP